MAETLAIIILTYNEESNIVECIQSANFADEVILIDSGSTDNTCSIAKDLGVKVFEHLMRDGFAGQRNFALTQTLADWVMFLDADERITSQLAAEIKETVEKGSRYAYKILRMNIAFGQKMRYGVTSPDYCLRLAPRVSMNWQGLAHESAIVDLPVRSLQQYMLHYTYTSWERYFLKFNQYTKLMAEQLALKGKQARLTDVTLRPIVAFLKMYILKSGWRDGRLGFILAVFHAFYTMTKYVRLYYLQKGRSR